jgi:hypothetical protein
MGAAELLLPLGGVVCAQEASTSTELSQKY